MDPLAENLQNVAAAHSLPPTQPGSGSEQDSHTFFQSLKIDWSELEQLCGLETNDLWVGSLWAGAYRLGVLRRSPLSLIVTELLVIALAGMVSLPLGLLLVRNSASTDPEAARAAIPFVMTVAIGMSALLLMRYRRMTQNRKRWRSLLGILDEVDSYHDSLKALELLDQLQEIHPPGPISSFRPGIEFEEVQAAPSMLEPATFEALALTRDSLVTGLLADRLLRQQQSQIGGRARYIDLLEHLDHNLATLTAFEASQQVTEEAQLLQDALKISLAVRRSITR